MGPWGIPLPSGKFPILSGLIGFLFGFVNRFMSWLMLMKLTGGLARIGIYMVCLIAIGTTVVGLVAYTNNKLTELVNNASPMGQMIISGIASALPTNTPYYITIILGYYVFSITGHLTIEIVKYKAKVADEATKRFIA